MVLQHSNATLPPEALFVLRFQKAHSFQKGAYSELMDAQDRAFLPWLASFQVREPPLIPQLALHVHYLIHVCKWLRFAAFHAQAVQIYQIREG